MAMWRQIWKTLATEGTSNVVGAKLRPEMKPFLGENETGTAGPLPRTKGKAQEHVGDEK